MKNLSSSIAVITINWNGYEDTLEFLNSFRKVTYNDFKIFIIDNDSNADEVTKLNTLAVDNVQLIKLNENLGFAGGNNVGIVEALEQNADFVLIINNDTIVEPDFLNILLDKFSVDQKIGIVAPQINYYSKPSRMWSAGGKISKLRGSGFSDSNKLESQILKIDREVEFVSGCCMLIKKEVIGKVGLFDENYFLYLEDTDLCYRVNKAGYKIIVTPKSKIFHKVNQSSKGSYSILPLYYTTRNRLYFAKKSFGETFIFTILYIFISMFLKSVYWLVTGKIKNIIAVKNAISDFMGIRMGRKTKKLINED